MRASAPSELQEGPVGVLARLAVLEPDRGGDPAHRDRRDPERGREPVGRAVAHRLHDGLAQRPQRDALSVGGAAAGQHRPALARDGTQLGDEAGLADARLADDGQELRRALRHDARERVAEAARPPPPARSAAGRAGGRSRAHRGRRSPAGSLRPRARRRARACRTTCQVDSESRISPPAPVRASRSATATASPMTGAASGGPLAATTSPVQTPERARRPNGSCSTRAPSSAAARSARRASSSCATGMPSTARTASLRRSTTLPSQLSQTAQRRGVEAARPPHAAIPGRRPPVRRAPVSWQKTHVTQRACPSRPARARAAATGSGTSWRRIADSSARSSGDGSIPSPSTSARWASRYASSASAWRPLR